MAATTVSTVYASAAITHIGSGASMAAGAMSGAADVSTALSSTNLLRYPVADIQLSISHTTSISSASNFLILHRRDLNFDGTNDDPVPATVTTALFSKPVGVFQVLTSGTTASASQALQATDIPLSDQCEFYIENRTNGAIVAGWTLKVLPKTDSLQ